MASDVWSLGATVLEILFDSLIWDMSTIEREYGVRGNGMAGIRLAMEIRTQPSLLSVLRGANARLQFLADCFAYIPQERPGTTSIFRGLKQVVLEGKHMICEVPWEVYLRKKESL